MASSIPNSWSTKPNAETICKHIPSKIKLISGHRWHQLEITADHLDQPSMLFLQNITYKWLTKWPMMPDLLQRPRDHTAHPVEDHPKARLPVHSNKDLARDWGITDKDPARDQGTADKDLANEWGNRDQHDQPMSSSRTLPSAQPYKLYIMPVLMPGHQHSIHSVKQPTK